ncbi:hypothetical protein [Mitsuaria sp. GD03876]|uniref:hypothetical protein n=1 Tax=Mitsuaria sp. GD03876 TaxID=2975399 RepID=UPI00244CD3B0|nr:hypothetical protein [Mitsuaria sp. GD03876]MDH0864621.1 hypothetical protein [Mitsuaria sp. GD03876]
MNLAFKLRWMHLWLGLFIGVQALLWMASGVYMTLLPIERVRGQHLVRIDDAPLVVDAARLEAAELVARHPGLEGFRLKQWLGREVYELRAGGRTWLVDARDGEALGPLPREQIAERARAIYQGEGALVEVSWLTRAPREVAHRPVPMWAARFDDRGATTLYFSPETGELLARRHAAWRWFDVLWMLHIMDYDQRSDANNTLLRVAAALGVVFAVGSAWLTLRAWRRKARR